MLKVLVLLTVLSGLAYAQENTLDIKEITGTETLPNMEGKNYRRWALELDSEFYFNQEQVVDQTEAQITSAQYFSFKYQLTERTQVRVVPTVEANSVPRWERPVDNKDAIANSKSYDGTRWLDTFIGSQTNSGHLFGSDIISTEVRYYIPMSELSKAEHSGGKFRLDLNIPWTVGKWTFSYYLNPRLTLTHDADVDSQTMSFREYGVATYSFNSRASAYAEAGHRFYSGPKNFLKATEEDNVLELGGTYSFNKTFGLTLIVTNVFTQGADNLNVLHADKNNFILASSIAY